MSIRRRWVGNQVMTNSTLRQRFGIADANYSMASRIIRDTLGEKLIKKAKVNTVFPGSLHVGVDLLIGPDYRGHAVLEANAFGDLLPGVLSGGMDTWEAEVRAVNGV